MPENVKAIFDLVDRHWNSRILDAVVELGVLDAPGHQQRIGKAPDQMTSLAIAVASA